METIEGYIISVLDIFEFIPIFAPNSINDSGLTTLVKALLKKFRLDANSFSPLFLSIYCSPNSPAQNSSWSVLYVFHYVNFYNYILY